MMGLLLRLGPYGDRFGLRRGGLNLRRLRAHPHGLVLADNAPTGVLHDVVRHPGGKVRLDPAQIGSEVRSLGGQAHTDPEFPLLLIGIREMRSQNSWMHNSPTLMRGGRRQLARINPVDATTHGIVDGGRVRIVSPRGAIETEVLITDDIIAGTVAVPQGWGHRGGGWTVANSSPGANVNELTSDQAADLERLAGMSVLNGVQVRIEAVASGDPAVGDQAIGDAAAHQIHE
jgi:formate dehydrogenase